MRYAVEQRLRLIDFLLLHYGSVGPDQLLDYYGIAPATATRDFSLYRQQFPGNAVFDTHSKLWIKGVNFKRGYS